MSSLFAICLFTIVGIVWLATAMQSAQLFHLKLMAVAAVGCMLSFGAAAELDPKLMREIQSWHSGAALPARLLKFPDGKIDIGSLLDRPIHITGDTVEDYVAEIRNSELLAALMFDFRTQPETFRAAAAQLIRVRGFDYVAKMLADKRKAQPALFARSEVSVLYQLLSSPCLTINAVRVWFKDLPAEQAEKALRSMRSDLESGTPWTSAYAKEAELHPDVPSGMRAPTGRRVRTLLGRLYSGPISPTGFDIFTYTITAEVPSEHLRELFRQKHGRHILRTEQGLYLYQIDDYFDNRTEN